MSLVLGANATLEHNPFFAVMLGIQSFPVLAALSGIARRACIECLNDPRATAENREMAQQALGSMRLVETAVDAPDPSPPKMSPSEYGKSRYLGQPAGEPE